jgi:hypothetical protein
MNSTELIYNTVDNDTRLVASRYTGVDDLVAANDEAANIFIQNMKQHIRKKWEVSYYLVILFLLFLFPRQLNLPF